MNKAITRLDLVEGATTIRQGHYFTLALTPRDENGNVIVLTGKIIHVVIVGEEGIVYETAGEYDSTKKVIRFSVTENIGYGEMWIEITVTSPTDSKYRMKFPTSEQDGKLRIIRSADAIEVVGIPNLTVEQFRKEFDQAIRALPVDSEIKLARLSADGTTYTNIKERLDTERAQTIAELNEKDEELGVLKNEKADKSEIMPIADGIEKLTEEKLSKNAIYKKEIFAKLPLRFADYQTIVNAENISYLYPQSFTIDWSKNEIFVLYVPMGGSSTKRWIVVYNLISYSYKRCFHAGNDGGEGIVIKNEGTNRYLYVKTTGQNLGKFLLNELPLNLSTLEPVQELDVGLDWQFGYRNGKWLINQSRPELGTVNRRTNFVKYDDAFNIIGTLNVGVSEGGFIVGDYVNYMPKRQGIGLGDGYLLQSMGGYTSKNAFYVPYNYQGLKMLNNSGSLIMDGLIDPDFMFKKLEENGYFCSRLESEGIHISPLGDVYTLLIHQDRLDAESTQSGIIIFKEFSRSADALDFSLGGILSPSFNSEIYSSGIFPRSGSGIMLDPLKGEVLNSVDKILDFMIGTSLKEFSFYSTSQTVKNIDGTNIPNSFLVTIKNATNETFFMTWQGEDNKFFKIYGTSGSRKLEQKNIENSGLVDWTPITFLNGASEYSSTLRKHYTVIPLSNGKRIVEINAVFKGITGPNKYGSIPSQYAPTSSITFSMPTSGKNHARWLLQSDGALLMENTTSTTNPLASDYFPVQLTYTI